MRKVIQISDGVHLCDDGTMWEKVWLNRDDPDMSWVQLPNVPQSEEKINKQPKPLGPPNTEYVRGR